MRKLTVLTFLSLDGIIQAPGSKGEDPSGGFDLEGWTVPYFDEFLGNVMDEQMSKPFDLLLGRITYDIFASYWPEHAEEWPGINEATKYVASHEPLEFTWENSVQLGDNVVEQIKELKAGNGPDLRVYGSGNFMQTLLANDLVDELWLKIFPVTLGKGKQLFGKGTVPAAFKLIESKTSPNGVIVANYKRAGEVETGSFKVKNKEK